MSIDDDENRKNASVENSLMKKVKIKNEFEGEQKKIGRGNIHAKRKRDKYGEISNVIKKNNENVTRKKPTKVQTMTVESSQAKTTIIHPRGKEKNFANKKWRKTVQNCCYRENFTLILNKF